ncbi:ABC transporter ATP-binding protein [Candidatus Spongiihabitans sp.]|uniref:ABC transporter ATP-binding protein n=1 Tax=Candidatus Spongiihabitans sp. TaxID=3101308 RepID=UPI003C7BAFAC
MTLALKNINAFYRSGQVLFDLSLEIKRGSVTTLLGRNGMGKTTIVNSIIGNLPCNGGEIVYNNEKIDGLPPFKIAQKGIGLVPEGRQIFPNLNVRENLIATAANYNSSAAPWSMEKVLELFPLLKDRLHHMGNQLSGGEQQMLAIGRGLMLNPQLLILDEATEGLAPLMRKEIWCQLETIKQTGKQTGISILLIDKNLDDLCRIADYHYIIEKGRVVWQGDSATLRSRPDLKARYLGV